MIASTQDLMSGVEMPFGRARDARLVRLALIGVGAFCMADATNAQAECAVRGQSYHFTSNGVWAWSMLVNSGGECSHRFSAGSRMIFKRLYLPEAPQHGTVLLREGGYYRYYSTAGYHGPDSFTLKICGNEGGQDGCAFLHYAVTVE